MTPEEQLHILTEGDLTMVVSERLNGDWTRLSELFTIPRSFFDEWADSVDLPHKRVLSKIHTWDGIYCIDKDEHWDVYVQERGIRVYEIGLFDDFKTAKREALASEYLNGVQLK